MFPTVTMCTQLHTLRTGSYAPDHTRDFDWVLNIIIKHIEKAALIDSFCGV